MKGDFRSAGERRDAITSNCHGAGADEAGDQIGSHA